MARKTEEVRSKLREKLTDIAERTIAEHGMGALKARTLAAEAGCAVGQVYNVFDDMTGLILAVNLRTFKRMGRDIRAAVEAKADAAPVDRLVTMAHGYLNFAAANPLLWRTLFDVEMSKEKEVPPWYLEELNALFAIIAEPLAQLYKGKSADDIDLMVRTLFSSIHGIVLLGLEKRISGVPLERIETMVSTLLLNATARAPEF